MAQVVLVHRGVRAIPVLGNTPREIGQTRGEVHARLVGAVDVGKLQGPIEVDRQVMGILGEALKFKR
jgi:hypothetical protein